MPTFENQSIIHASPEQLRTFHEQPTALPKLSPPLIIVQILRDDRRSLTEGELEFNLWFGPFPIHWVALHQPGPTENSFVDVMLNGPMASWHHEHRFDAHPEGAMLIDRVTYTHQSSIKGLLTRLIFGGIPLRILFMYRHWRTRITLNNNA
jgi:hypothetical protein